MLAEAGGSPLPRTEVKAICRTLKTGEKGDINFALELAVKSRVSDIDPKLLFPISRGDIAAGTYASDDASHLLIKQYDHDQIKDHLDDYWRAKSAARKPEDAKEFLDKISADLAEYKEHRGGGDDRWERYDLPSEIVTYLDRERVAEWTRAFDSWDGAGWRFWSGLIRPTFEWCLRNAAGEQARTLWPQICPFQRRRFGGGSIETIDGVDSVLHALNRPEADEDLTRSFLTELILDARTDLELFEIALGARLRGSYRLRELAQELSTDPQAETRTRAVAILGWLVEGKEQLEDPLEERPFYLGPRAGRDRPETAHIGVLGQGLARAVLNCQILDPAMGRRTDVSRMRRSEDRLMGLEGSQGRSTSTEIERRSVPSSPCCGGASQEGSRQAQIDSTRIQRQRAFDSCSSMAPE